MGEGNGTHPNGLFIGKGDEAQYLDLAYANRHGLITGATGTGKTVTLQILAQGFSDAGVPVFAPDIKGDLAGISQAGEMKDFLTKRANTIGLDPYVMGGAPVAFWDLFGEDGHPVRTTVSEMGPLLLSRLMGLNDVQSGVLDIAFRIADEQGLLVLDLKDLRALLVHVAEQAKDISITYGQVSRTSVGAIQRRLLSLEEQGGDKFFGEPALALSDLMRKDSAGRGVVNILSASALMTEPKLYATFLMWLLAELFEQLPEVGDPDKPKLVFFFDEAHMLFRDAPPALVEKIEQLVRLIRSKGVGVFFVTQSPLDIPDRVLGQLACRIQHALRAFTPRDRKAIAAVGDTFRQNPKFDASAVIPELGIGEALVSTLQAKGVPSMVDRTLIRPPASRMGPISEQERAAILGESPLRAIYGKAIDRKSAYEMLQGRADERPMDRAGDGDYEGWGRPARTGGGWGAAGSTERAEVQRDEQPRARYSRDRTSGDDGWGKSKSRSSSRQTAGEAFIKSLSRSAGTQIGRQLTRGLLGSLFGGR